MNEPALLLVLLNFAIIGLLPRLFFRPTNRLGPWWWATALPFFLCPVLLIRAYLVDAAPSTPASWSGPLALVSVAAGTAATALIFLTIGTHRVPLSLWHQEDDAPGGIVTHGAYRRMRHPFYTSYVLTVLAALALFPDWAVLGLSAYTVAILTYTARKEERRLCASAFGAEYRRYMARTGRFLPSLKG